MLLVTTEQSRKRLAMRKMQTHGSRGRKAKAWPASHPPQPNVGPRQTRLLRAAGERLPTPLGGGGGNARAAIARCQCPKGERLHPVFGPQARRHAD